MPPYLDGSNVSVRRECAGVAYDTPRENKHGWMNPEMRVISLLRSI